MHDYQKHLILADGQALTHTYIYI